MGLIFGLLYFGVIGALLYSSLTHRKEGWLAGFLFALSLLTLPLWVAGLIWISGAWPD
jgi:hypothetical protein